MHLTLWDSIIPLVKGSTGILTRGVLRREERLRRFAWQRRYRKGQEQMQGDSDVKGPVMEGKLEIKKMKCGGGSQDYPDPLKQCGVGKDHGFMS